MRSPFQKSSALGLCLLGLLASLGAAAPLGSGTRAVESRAQTVRIMPFGASIVEITCWRAYLWKNLQSANIKNINFVGSHNTPSSGCKLSGQPITYPAANEGHSGARVTDYASQNKLPAWLAAAKPDMILMHVATNDATAGKSVSEVMSAYSKLLSQMRASNPNTVLILSKLIPIDPNLFGQAVADRVVAYNAAMGGWARENSRSGSEIVVVDMFTGFDYKTMTTDGLHPNERGDVLMAQRFFEAVRGRVAVS